jgi:hypothetical protein
MRLEKEKPTKKKKKKTGDIPVISLIISHVKVNKMGASTENRGCNQHTCPSRIGVLFFLFFYLYLI